FSQYPNMPAWLSRAKVYASWLLITAIGAAGLVAVRSRFVLAGFILLAVYAALGFGGLGPYALAPVSAHNAAMKLAVGFEVVSAGVLLLFALRCVFLAGRQSGAGRMGA